MRLLAVLLALSAALAGCSGSTDGPDAGGGGEFDDLGVRPTETTGVLLGVVVDEAIRPVAGATVALSKPDGSSATDETDAQGRFAFGGLAPGTYVVHATHPSHLPVQSSAEVVAGVEEPPVLRMMLERLFSQDPYTEQIKFDGYLACAYAVGVSSTCVNDYTRLIGFVPGCEGGCLKDHNVSRAGGNVREFRTDVGPGWQALVFEMHWEPSVGPPASKGTLGMTVSYFNRTSTGHWYASGDGPSPLRLEVDVGVPGPDQNEEPELIPPEGMQDLFVFFSAGDEDVAVNQPFQFFQTSFYYGVPPDGWSFVAGDELPF